MRLLSILLLLPLCLLAQDDIEPLEAKIAIHQSEIEVLRNKIEDIKMGGLIEQLKASGLPTEDYVEHSAMIIAFDEEHKQASWVAHIISPEIRDGRVTRTNDFRDDPLIEGEAVEADYFLKELQADSSYIYDGFGYDRGHLAPSADFKWSYKALSESYFYSNMSPQRPDFNREDWAELEAILRSYVINNEVPLYVVTLPLYDAEPQLIERGVNQLPIPDQYMKVVYDDVNERGIAFLMDNYNRPDDIADHAISIDRAEEVIAWDFFSAISEEAAEAEFKIEEWFPESTQMGVEPLYAPSLPPEHINTTQARRWMGSPKKINVCGTVVHTRFSGSGNYWFNVDKKFPNTVFTVYIRKDDFKNFDSVHKDYLLDKKVCFHGKVTEMFSQPSMNITRQEQVKLFD